MSYAVRTVIAGLWREKWINTLCTFTIGAGLLIISLAALVVFNVHNAMEKMPDRFSIMIFLDEDISSPPEVLMDSLGSLEGVRKARFISKDEALNDLRGSLEDADLVLKGMEGEENPLPASVELTLKRDSVTDEAVERIAQQASAIDGVDDVHFASSVLRVIQSLRLYVEGAGFGLVICLATAVLFVSYSTVKILLYRKLDEIDTLKYLGATKSFIRSPFLMEGAIIGTFAGILALAGLGLVYSALVLELGSQLPLLRNIVFPLALLPALPLAGLSVGMTGAFLALGRIRF